MPLNSTFEAIRLNSILFNQGNRFNLTHFSPVNNGYYWFHVSVGLSQNATKVSLVNEIDNYVRMSDWSDISHAIMSFDVIQWVNSNASVHVMSESPLYSDNTGQISFIGFEIGSVMKSLVAVQIQLHYEASSGKLIDSTVDIASNWNNISPNSEQLIVPRTGIYILTASLQTLQSEIAPCSVLNDPRCDNSIPTANNVDSWTLTVANAPPVLLLYQIRDARSHQLTTSLVYLLSLTESDEISAKFSYINQPAFVKLQMVLYEPSKNLRVAWALRRDQPQLNFSIDVSEGISWDKYANVVNIPKSGVYYISLTATFDTATQHQTRVLRNDICSLIILSINNTATVGEDGIIITRESGLTTLQQSLLYTVNEGDILRVEEDSYETGNINHNFYGDDLVYFMGILLMPQ